MSEIRTVGREVLACPPTAEHPRAGEGSFLRLKDGRILYIYSRFTESTHDDAPSNLTAVWSSDEGETWTEPVEILFASEHGVKNVMSVSLMAMQNGDVGMFYGVKAAPDCNQMWLARSADGGETWYARRECTLADP